MQKSIRTLHLESREEWRGWLEKNHGSAREIWLLYHKRHTCKPRIPYDEAVEEAICFGWIDSIIRRVDENSYCQKFTPRRKGSRWTALNVDRARRMIESGRMTEKGMARYMEVVDNPGLVRSSLPNISTLEVPPELKRALRETKGSSAVFFAQPPSYRKMCIAWVSAAKKSETRERRAREISETSARGERIGLK